MNNLPVIIGNIASSLDGKIAPFDRSRMTISVEEDFRLRDIIRTMTDGVLVGGTTLNKDNPTLTIKNPDLVNKRIEMGKTPQPAGIALCGKNLPDKNNRFFSAVNSRRIIICGSSSKPEFPECEIIQTGEERPDITEAMKILYDKGIQSLMVEGGGTIMFEFLRLKLMKEFFVSIHPVIVGGSSSPTTFDGDGFSICDVQRLNIVSTKVMSDGGTIYHCTVGDYEPVINF